MNELPKFVRMGGKNGTALRLRNDTYYRDGGAWDVGYKFFKGKLYSSSHVSSVNEKELVECTEEEWREDNGSYAPF